MTDRLHPPGDYGPEIHLPPAYDARCTSCGRTRGECRRIVYYLDHITGCCNDCFAGRATHQENQ